MDKFGRNYVLKFQDEQGNALTSVTLPISIEFDITRNTLTSANVCQIRLYNLSAQNRNLIRHNRYDYGSFKSIQLQAGYGDTAGLPIVFSGNISAAWSVREGINFITTIECFDGGYAFVNGNINISFISGTPYQTVIQSIAALLPNVSIGYIGSYPGSLTKGNTYSGNAIEILKELTGGGFFIDKGKAYALGTYETIPTVGSTFTINSQSGLLGTPVLEQNIVRFDILFEPALDVGTQINLQSSTEKGFNGLAKVVAVKHHGMISPSLSGSVVTTGEFLQQPPGSISG